MDKVDLLKEVARDYGLDAEELAERYLSGSNIDRAKLSRSCAKKKRNDYVETEEHDYHGVTYLVDARNQVYTYNLEKPLMVGERLVDGSIKFFEGYVSEVSTQQ